MDSNATLIELRAALADYFDADEKRDLIAVAEAAGRVAVLISELDAWIVRGGFLPRAWQMS